MNPFTAGVPTPPPPPRKPLLPSQESRERASKKFSWGILLPGQSSVWDTRKSPSLGFLSCELDPVLSVYTLIEKSPGVEKETGG